ncbi:MAG: amidohydrolase [Longimicrobiales bacterium]
MVPGPLMLLADRAITMGTEFAPVAIVIANGRIEAIGPAAEVRPGRAVRVLDLAGTIVTPGLVDAHIHLTEWALARRDLDLSGTRSPEEAASQVAGEEVGRAGGWIRGRGWNPHLWNGREPHRSVLDVVVPGVPIALQSHDMHALWVNGEAMARAGITSETADPAGGRIVRDSRGDATGLLLENAAELVTRVVPAPDPAATVDAVLEAQAVLHAFGITGVHAFPSIHIPEAEPLSGIEAVRASGRLRLRVLQHLPLRMLDEALRIGLRSGFGGEWIRIGAIKMFLDGALGSRTAWMRAPYENDAGRFGVQTMERGEFGYHVRRAAAAGLATTVHAIGDAAVGLALDVLNDQSLAVAAMPHRIEHVQCCPPERVGEPGAAGITCSVQPAHLMTDWAIADRHWGPARARATYAFRSFLGGGAVLAFGSDAPVEPADPRLGLHAAVTRMTPDGMPASGWYAEQRLSAHEALHGYTRGPAVAAGRPDHGRLVAGLPADLVAWDRDPTRCSPAELLGLRAEATIVGGDVVHS